MNSLYSVDVSLSEAGVMRNGEKAKGANLPPTPTLSSAIFVESSWEITKLLGPFAACEFQL
jgi:hypothetical protein